MSTYHVSSTFKSLRIRGAMFFGSILLSTIAAAKLPNQPVPVDVQAGGATACELMSNGRVDCWGFNDQGQVGTDPHLLAVNVKTPVQYLGNAKAIAVGSSHACAVLTSGQVRCWGTNFQGQLGSSQNVGTSIPNPNPVTVTGLAGPVTEISAGQTHTCAIVAGDPSIIQCWGDNSNLELGSNAGSWSAIPVTVPGVFGARAIAAGWGSTCALTDASWKPAQQVCWGDNSVGALGIGIFSFNELPGAQIQGSAIDTLSAGSSSRSACGVYADGTLHCWGFNQNGELGDATFTSQSFPVQLQSPHNPSAVAGSVNGRCLIDAGAVYCWGDNGAGEVGIGVVSPAIPTPVLPAIASGASSITVGGQFACAIVGTQVKCWGGNAQGALGNGTYVDSYVPVPTVF